MPTPVKAQITSWSYSRLQVYRKCPAQAKYKFIDKLPEPSSDAMARGTAIHKLAEQYLKGEIKALPKELKLFAAEFKAEYKSKAEKLCEQDWAFTSGWLPTDWRDWKGAWVRVKVDYISRPAPEYAEMRDWKTGRTGLGDPPGTGVYEQLMLYAVAGFKTWPELQEVKCIGSYLDHGQDKEATYQRTELPKLVTYFDRESRALLRDKTFKATPSDFACRYCAYAKSKGGPCDLA